MVSALAAMVLGLAAAVYAVWPLLGEGRAAGSLQDDADVSEDAETALAAVLGWAAAAGETSPPEEAAVRRGDPRRRAVRTRQRPGGDGDAQRSDSSG